MWKKIWAWLKKYGSYILAFIGGIVSYLFIDTGRNKRADEYIASLTARLEQYEELIGKLEYNIGELTNNISSMETTAGELRTENDKLRGILESSQRDIIESRKSLDNLRLKLESAGDDIDKLSDIDNGLKEQSVRIDSGFAKLADFITKYGTQTSVL